MIRALQQILETHLGGDAAPRDETPEEAVNLATAALLMEMVRSDFEVDAQELETVKGVMRGLVGGNEKALHELLRRAEQEAEESVSLYEFTRLIHENLDPAEKLEIVENLWRVAFADGRLDDHEVHMMRKVQGLLHIPQEDFVAAKQRARDGKP